MNLVELALVMVYDGGICGLGLVVVYELRLVADKRWWYMAGR